jgi:nucleoside-diphosphate-sugar epimerase
LAIAVTGADGFTGTHFLQAAGARGIAAVALAGDLTDARAVADAVARLAPRRVLHLAGIAFVGHADPRALYEVNLLGTINLLEALCALPQAPECVVLASSAQVYGNAALPPISESTPPAPASHYAVSKLAMEMAAARYAVRLPIVIARPFNYTGLGQSDAFVVPKLVDHFRRRAPAIQLGDIDVEREFNDVRFVCEAYLGLLEQGVPGETYNVCSGNPVTLRELLETLERLTGHAPAVERDPALVRPIEVRRLCGDPTRLQQTVGPLAVPPLEDTLRWMLAAEASS